MLDVRPSRRAFAAPQDDEWSRLHPAKTFRVMNGGDAKTFVRVRRPVRAVSNPAAPVARPSRLGLAAPQDDEWSRLHPAKTFRVMNGGDAKTFVRVRRPVRAVSNPAAPDMRPSRRGFAAPQDDEGCGISIKYVRVRRPVRAVSNPAQTLTLSAARASSQKASISSSVASSGVRPCSARRFSMWAKRRMNF